MKIRGLVLCSLKNIDNSFMNHSALIFAYIPKVEAVCNSCFKFCQSLRKFYSKRLVKAGTEAFFGCVSLTEVSFLRVLVVKKGVFGYC